MADYNLDSFISQIRDFAQVIKLQVDIVEHISKYETLTKSGKAWQGPHSLHSSQGGKCFSINVTQAYYNCYSCHEAGDVIGFEQKRLQVTPFEAMKSLARDYGIHVPDFEGIEKLSPEEYKKIEDDIEKSARIKNLQDMYCQMTEDALQDYDKALDYLDSRGLTLESIKKFRLGYGYEDINKELIDNGFTKAELIASGLFSENLQILLNRITIPTFDKSGKPCHFIGRSLPGGVEPKYLSQRSQQGQNPYAVHRTFWSYGNLEDKLEDKKTSKPLLIVEGSIDGLLAAQEYDKDFVIASANTTILSQEQIQNMINWLYPSGPWKPCDIIICNDNDTNRSGHEGAKKTILNLYQGCLNYVIKQHAKKENITDKEQIQLMLIDKEYIAAAMPFIPDIKMAILRKPPGLDKIDLSDIILMGRVLEAFYWIQSAITLDQYNEWLINNSKRFFHPNKTGSNSKLLPKLVANEIHFEGNYFINVGGLLLWYNDGVYLPCQNALRVLIQNKLGSHVEPEQINKVYGLIETMSHDLSLTVDYDISKDDPNRSWVNTKSGWLDFDKPIFSHDPEPHTPFRPSFAKIPVIYNPKASSPIFDKFIGEVLSKEDIGEFIKLLGYLPVRTLKYDKAFLFVGHGGNGKSTAIDVLYSFLGGENCWWSSLDDLETKTFALPYLVGKLANFHTDLPPGYIPSSGVFKRISSGEMVTGERKYGEEFDFFPDCTLVFSANEIPRTNDTSYGYYRRWTFFAFDRQFSDTDDEDINLPEKLTTNEELSGILNLAWIGYQNLINQGGFEESERSKTVKTEYTEANDIIAAFINEAVVDSPGSQINRSDLFNFFKIYLQERGTGREKVSAIRFNKRLRQLKPTIELTSDRSWLDIDLNSDLVKEFDQSSGAYDNMILN